MCKCIGKTKTTWARWSLHTEIVNATPTPKKQNKNPTTNKQVKQLVAQISRLIGPMQFKTQQYIMPKWVCRIEANVEIKNSGTWKTT